jgi:hypothetical protein
MPLNSRVGSWPYLQTVDYTNKGFARDRHSSSFGPFVNYGRKKFYNICPCWMSVYPVCYDPVVALFVVKSRKFKIPSFK